MKQMKASMQLDCMLDISNFHSLLCDSKWKIDKDQFSTLADTAVGVILIDSLNTKDRVLSYALLSKMISMKLFDEQQTKIYPFLDKAGYLIEHVSTTDELSSLSNLIVVIFSWNFYDINVRISKTISKFIGSLVRVIQNNKNQIDLSYILDILISLLENDFIRNELPKSCINLIYSTCLPLTIHPSLHLKVSTVIAILLSFEQVDDWNHTFLSLCKEVLKVFELIDITFDRNGDYFLGHSIINENNNSKPYRINFYDSILSSLDNVSELKRGLLIESCICGILSLMKNMLSNGSNSGPISIDLTICISIFSTVLGRDMDLSNQARCSIQNIHGISANIIFPVLCQIKLSLLDLLYEILSHRSSNLYKMSYIITETMTSLLLSLDFKYNKDFFAMTLRCIDRVIKCFPSVIANTCVEGTQSSSTGIGYLIEIYAPHLVDVICNDGQTVFSSTNENPGNINEYINVIDNSANNENIDTVDSIISILSVSKSLLIFCSHSLPISLRKSVEIMSAKMLSAIGKGVLLRVPKDKRIKRAQVSIIRSNFALQKSALDLALTEMLAPFGDGKMSGNSALLQNACKACLCNNEVSGLCAQILLIIDNISTPSMVSIPSVSINVLAKNALELSNDHNIANTNVFHRENKEHNNIGNKRNDTIGFGPGKDLSLASTSNSSSSSSSSSFNVKSVLDNTGFNETHSNKTNDYHHHHHEINNSKNNKRVKVEEVRTSDKTLQSRVDDALKKKLDDNDSDIEIPEIN